MTPSSEESKFVLPGDYLGTAEEFFRDGAPTGTGGGYHVGPRDLPCRPEGPDGPGRAPERGPRIQEGEIVYARVDELKTAMAICTILTTSAATGGPERAGGDRPRLEGEGRVHRVALERVRGRRHHPRQGPPVAPVRQADDRALVPRGRLRPMPGLPQPSRPPPEGARVPPMRPPGAAQARPRSRVPGPPGGGNPRCPVRRSGGSPRSSGPTTAGAVVRCSTSWRARTPFSGGAACLAATSPVATPSPSRPTSTGN